MEAKYHKAFDVAVIGTGFGGIGAALTLAQGGARVVVCESLRYPGGCASTFVRRSYRFESGATLFSGFGENQIFRKWIDQYQLPVHVDLLPELVELRSAAMDMSVPNNRVVFLDRMCALAPRDEQNVRAFFAEQKVVADLLWELFEKPELLPGKHFFAPKFLFSHLLRLPRYGPLARVVGRSLDSVLRRHTLHLCKPLRTYLNAICQITVQTNCAQAEAPFALAAMDYFFRGTGHVFGGIGSLATSLTDQASKLGAEVLFTNRVKRVSEEQDGLFHLHTRRGLIKARHVIANLTPHAMPKVFGQDNKHLHRLREGLKVGWGAVMLYRAIPSPAQHSESAHHLELIDDDDSPFSEGNHVFVSMSDGRELNKAPQGQRTLTCSTHVPMRELLNHQDPASYVQTVQQRMRQTITMRAPELDTPTLEMPGSPRTFERFTGRDQGYVGGAPRLVGLHNYQRMGPQEIFPRVFMVGDSVFPGQSTVATALSGVKAAEAILAP